MLSVDHDVDQSMIITKLTFIPARMISNSSNKIYKDGRRRKYNLFAKFESFNSII